MQMEHWVIYDRPKDYPDKCVVRRFLIAPNQVIPQECYLADSLEQARRFIPSEFNVCIGRDPSDDPAIYETWIC